MAEPTKLDEELIPYIMPVLDIIESYDIVVRQKVLEIIAARHAIICKQIGVQFVIDSMHRHITTLAKQMQEFNYWSDGQHREPK